MQRRKFICLTAASTLSVPVFSSNKSLFRPNKEGTIIEAEKEIPVMGKYDVVICGAGPAGVCAAIASARMGVKTLLIESSGCLGGTWTAGLLTWILDKQNKTGVLKEIIDELVSQQSTMPAPSEYIYPFDPEAMKLLLEQKCLEAGVDIMLHTRVVGTVKSGEKAISHVFTESVSGREAWEGNMFVDCTGNGDLAAYAGCGFEFGDPETGLTQPFSMLFLFTGPKYADIEQFIRRAGESGNITKKRLLKEIVSSGVNPSYELPAIFPIRNNLFMMMANHEYGQSGISRQEVTSSTIRARKEVNQICKGLRSLGDAWKDMRVVATPEHIGIREARRIHGLYTVTVDDLTNGAKHDDAICRVTFPVDVHALKKGDEENAHAKKILSQNYDIPLRSLISKDIDNLLMAGRNISGDFIAHSSYRVTGNAAPMGEAAGKTAALAVVESVLPKQVDFFKVLK